MYRITSMYNIMIDILTNKKRIVENTQEEALNKHLIDTKRQRQHSNKVNHTKTDGNSFTTLRIH